MLWDGSPARTRTRGSVRRRSWPRRWLRSDVTAALRHEWPRLERDRKIKPGCVSGLADGLGRPRLGGDAQRSGARPRPAERGVQAFGRLLCCCRLRGVLLCLAQLADRPGQRDEARRQVKCGRRGAGLAAACQGEEPGGGAEPVSLCGPGRDLPVGGPCGPVETCRRPGAAPGHGSLGRWHGMWRPPPRPYRRPRRDLPRRSAGSAPPLLQPAGPRAGRTPPVPAR
jgi:hypothetical protein